MRMTSYIKVTYLFLYHNIPTPVETESAKSFENKNADCMGSSKKLHKGSAKNYFKVLSRGFSWRFFKITRLIEKLLFFRNKLLFQGKQTS